MITTKEITKNENSIDVYESKWGFHPCSREIYQKLRKLNFWLLQAKKGAGRYHRWFRKDEQNQVIRKRIRNEEGQVIGYESPIPMTEPKIDKPFCSIDKPEGVKHWGPERTWNTHWATPTCYTYDVFRSVYVETFGIEDDYKRAKYPTVSENVQPLKNSPEEIDRLYKLVIDFKLKNE